MRTKRTLALKRGDKALKGHFQAFISVLKAFVPTKNRPEGRQKALKGLKTSFFLKEEGVRTKW